MPQLEPGVYPVARALNLANSGRRVSVSVTLPDGGTADVQALALNNINATSCQVFVDENGNATVSNPADTGRQLSQTIGRYVHRLPSPVAPVLIPQEPTGIITWWSFTWVDTVSLPATTNGVVASDPVVPDDFYIYKKYRDFSAAPTFFRYLVGITENDTSKTVTVDATKLTASALSSFNVFAYYNRGADVYPDPTPASYSGVPSIDFFFLLPSFVFSFATDGGGALTSSGTFSFTIPAGRTIIEVLEDNPVSPDDIAEPPVPSWTFGASLA